MSELLLNSKLWDHLTEDERNQILTTLRKVGAIRAEDTISSSKDAPIRDIRAVRANLESVRANTEKGVQPTACQVACGTAAGGALGACSLLDPLLVEQCLAAAEMGYEACMAYCDE